MAAITTSESRKAGKVRYDRASFMIESHGGRLFQAAAAFVRDACRLRSSELPGNYPLVRLQWHNGGVSAAPPGTNAYCRYRPCRTATFVKSVLTGSFFPSVRF